MSVCIKHQIGRHILVPSGFNSIQASEIAIQCAFLYFHDANNCSVLFFSRPRSEGWPHHERTFSIYPCPLSFWLTLPRRVLSKSWCCPSRPCVAFLAFVHLALFLALSLSPGNSLVSSLCDHTSFSICTDSYTRNIFQDRLYAKKYKTRNC